MPIFPDNHSQIGALLPAKLVSLAAGFNVSLHCGEAPDMEGPLLLSYDAENRYFLAFINTHYSEDIYLPAFAAELEKLIRRFSDALVHRTDRKRQHLDLLFRDDLIRDTMPRLVYRRN